MSLIHLFFVDDIVLFEDVDEGTIAFMKSILENFCFLYELKISTDKYRIMFSGNTP